MSVFRFKRFNVVNERSAMKVNTDGVLLGAVMTVTPFDRQLLDIGTGTGTIALMAAQRLTDLICGPGSATKISEPLCENMRIDAIDIDEPSATEAAENFRNSPWREILKVHHACLEEYATRCKDLQDPRNHRTFDLIFSNPPYFDNALQAPEHRRNTARHTSTGLSYREILDFAAEHLSETGRVALVLPSDTEPDLTRYARMCGLHLYKITRVRTVPRKSPNRIIAEFSRHRKSVMDDAVLTIQNDGQYTEEYLSVTRDFYLFA